MQLQKQAVMQARAGSDIVAPSGVCVCVYVCVCMYVCMFAILFPKPEVYVCV